MRTFGGGKRYRSRLFAYLMAFSSVLITIAMVQYPKDAFDAAIMGLNLWWNVVFPIFTSFFHFIGNPHGTGCSAFYRHFA